MIPNLLLATPSEEGDEDDRKENLLDFFTELPDASTFERDQIVHKKSVDETFIPRRFDSCSRIGLILCGQLRRAVDPWIPWQDGYHGENALLFNTRDGSSAG
jgi:hypothetical protein